MINYWQCWVNYKYSYINYQVIKLQVLITASVKVIKLQILITNTKSRNAAPIRIIMLNPLRELNPKLLQYYL